jgi:alpha-mannosidase
VNHLPRPWSGIVEVDGRAVHAEVGPFAAVEASSLAEVTFAGAAERTDGALSVHSPFAVVTFSDGGDIISMKVAGREVIPPDDFASFVLRADTPAEYDNWDIDMADADRVPEHVPSTNGPVLVESGPVRTVVEFNYATESSLWTTRYILLPDRMDVEVDADWHEEERRLQWRLPVDVHAREAVCGTQFGHVRRPRHANTSWDAARFEVCAHRWVAVHEPGFGVAVVADGPRGWDVRGNSMQLTVLRSPKYPDPLADRGSQRIRWSVTSLAGDPAAENFELRAEQILNPPRVVHGAPSMPPPPLRILEQGSVMISAVKPADDGSGDLIVRAWESAGGRSTALIEVPGSRDARFCNVLEDPTDGGPSSDSRSGTWELALSPFEIVTVRFGR